MAETKTIFYKYFSGKCVLIENRLHRGEERRKKNEPLDMVAR